MLLNLAVNARDAMPQGGILTLGLDTFDAAADFRVYTGELKAGLYAVLSIEDTGEGIPPDIMNKVFEPFFTTKPHGKGTGLGLSTVLGIVRSHGGAIDLQSKPGNGSVFRVYLPALSVDMNDEGERPAPPALQGNGRTILIVDDEKMIRQLGKALLEQMGFRVLEAGNGREALAIFEQQTDTIHGIITDIMMPVMSGESLAVKVWERRPEVPILFMSGLTEQDHLNTSFSQLHQREAVLLRKPFEIAEFVRLLKQVLEASPHSIARSTT